MSSFNLLAALALGAWASGCTLQETKTPAVNLPQSFAAALQVGPWPSEDWYGGFQSAELNSLVEAAARSNLSLQMASARVRQADAHARQAGGALLPSVDAGANGNFLAGHSRNGNAHETDWGVLLSASYEVDFWGKNRAALRSADALSQASRADRDTMALTTLAAVASGYFQALSLADRLDIAMANRDTAMKLLSVVQARFDAGSATPVEVATQRAALASAELVLPDLQQQRGEALAALAVLLGRAPEDFSLQDRSLEAIAEPQVTAGLPSELLTRRPDVAAAEANMRAAAADLVVARAALFPSLSLTASGGVQNPALNAAVITLSGIGPTLNLGAGLVQPIFDGGRLRAVRAEVQAKDEELILAYRAAILVALQDVENALNALRHLNEAQRFEEENITQSNRAFEGATLRYQQGAGDFLTVLESQRTLYSARDQYSQYRLARLQALIALGKALGGGWGSAALQASTRDVR
jgi:outer membrane protein, multidrug efflux system